MIRPCETKTPRNQAIKKIAYFQVLEKNFSYKKSYESKEGNSKATSWIITTVHFSKCWPPWQGDSVWNSCANLLAKQRKEKNKAEEVSLYTWIKNLFQSWNWNLGNKKIKIFIHTCIHSPSHAHTLPHSKKQSLPNFVITVSIVCCKHPHKK